MADVILGEYIFNNGPSQMEYVRDALKAALKEGISLEDCVAMAEHAKTPESFNVSIYQFILGGKPLPVVSDRGK